MKCIQCGHETGVINSRLQKRVNSVWRRRKCTECATIFTTIEATDLAQALRLQRGTHLEPFSRDILFISIYDSLRHRKSAIPDASALTTTITSKATLCAENAVIDRDTLVTLALEVLTNFDTAAATHYGAFHNL